MPRHCCCSCCFRARFIIVTERHHFVVLPRPQTSKSKIFGEASFPVLLIKSAYDLTCRFRRYTCIPKWTFQAMLSTFRADTYSCNRTHQEPTTTTHLRVTIKHMQLMTVLDIASVPRLAVNIHEALSEIRISTWTILQLLFASVQRWRSFCLT